MRFGPLPPERAVGAVLAHSEAVADGRLRKGRRLSEADCAALAAAGRETVTVAVLEFGDVLEDEAALRVARALAGPEEGRGLALAAPGAGRVNLLAARRGLLRVDAAAVTAANLVDEALTVATLPPLARVEPRRIAATVKVIPYAAPERAVARVEALLRAAEAVAVAPVAMRSAGIVLTATPGMRPALLDKGAEALRLRLAALGLEVASEARVAHETSALATALRRAEGEIVLVLTGSATSDRRDVGPAALEAAGGRLQRLGMPVDPGNLSFLGALRDGRPALGLPGSTRSPKLSGGDRLLERLVCGLPIADADVAAMGVGGLLKEIPARPEPRAGAPRAARPRVSALLLAAGRSARMRGRDKLMEPVEGRPLIRRAAEALLASRVAEVVVALAPADAARRAALDGLAVRIAPNPLAAEGMASSIRAALAAAAPEADAALVALADMPEVGPGHVDALVAAYDPEAGRDIVRAATAEGRPGHPVLFGRRFFEALSRLEGDEGARAVLSEHADRVALVRTPGGGAAVDLDTPEAWAAWRAGR